MSFLSPNVLPRTARANVYIYPLVTSDGITKTYELNKVISGKTALQIFIDGNYQDQAAFNVGFNGTSVVLTEAAPKDTKLEFRLITNEDKLRTVDDQVIQHKHLEPDFLRKVTRSTKNYLINGDFDIWQRGTSLTSFNGSTKYIADRWAEIAVGSSIGITQQLFSLGQTDVPGNPKFFHRATVNSVVGASNYADSQQRIESLRKLSNKLVTISFYAKADSNKKIALAYSANFGSGGSTQMDVPLGSFNLTTSWVRYTKTATLPDLLGKTGGSNPFGLLLFLYDAGSDFSVLADNIGQQSGIFDLARVQLEEGPVVTDFEERSYSDEFRLCQRYFQDYSGGLALVSSLSIANGGSKLLPVVMRVAPTITSVSGGTGGVWVSNGVTLQQQGSNSIEAASTTLHLSAEL